jgi:hypothetical protein
MFSQSASTTVAGDPVPGLPSVKYAGVPAVAGVGRVDDDVELSIANKAVPLY